MCVCVCVCVCAGECHGARYPCAWCGTGRARYRLCGRRLGIEARRRGQGVERDIGPSEKCGQKWRSGIWSAAQLDCFLTWQNHSARIVTLASLSSFGFSGGFLGGSGEGRAEAGRGEMLAGRARHEAGPDSEGAGGRDATRFAQARWLRGRDSDSMCRSCGKLASSLSKSCMAERLCESVFTCNLEKCLARIKGEGS